MAARTLLQHRALLPARLPPPLRPDSARSQPAHNMHLYGQFPTCEDFSLQCSVCSRVVQPQDFLSVTVVGE